VVGAEVDRSSQPDVVRNRPALSGDRAANAKRAIVAAKERAVQVRAHFDDAGTREAFCATRKREGTDDKFCWK
jgi:hypothetical protein